MILAADWARKEPLSGGSDRPQRRGTDRGRAGCLTGRVVAHQTVAALPAALPACSQKRHSSNHGGLPETALANNPPSPKEIAPSPHDRRMNDYHH